MNVLREPVQLCEVVGNSKYSNCYKKTSSMCPEAKVTHPAIIETIQTKPFPIRGEWK